MTGFDTLQIAIRPTNGGNYAVVAVMGPDDFSYANLRPVNPAATLKNNIDGGEKKAFLDAFDDSSEALTADVWNIFMIYNVLANQKLLQFKITNNSGGEADIETAFLRLV